MTRSHYKWKNNPKLLKSDGTPLFIKTTQKFPVSMEYATQCVEIVQYLMYKHQCTLDQVLEKLGVKENE
jgi:hypothetical protein